MVARRLLQVVALAVLIFGCASVPSEDDAQEQFQRWLRSTRTEICSQTEFQGAHEKEGTGRWYFFDANCGHPTTPLEKRTRKHFGVLFVRLPSGWEFDSVKQFSDVAAFIAEDPDPGFSLRDEVGRRLIRTWGIPIGIAIVLWLAWSIFAPGDSKGVQTRWFRMTRRSKQPHQTKSHYSVTHIDLDDRDERK